MVKDTFNFFNTNLKNKNNSKTQMSKAVENTYEDIPMYKTSWFAYMNDTFKKYCNFATEFKSKELITLLDIENVNLEPILFYFCVDEKPNIKVIDFLLNLEIKPTRQIFEAVLSSSKNIEVLALLIKYGVNIENIQIPINIYPFLLFIKNDSKTELQSNTQETQETQETKEIKQDFFYEKTITGTLPRKIVIEDNQLPMNFSFDYKLPIKHDSTKAYINSSIEQYDELDYQDNYCTTEPSFENIFDMIFNGSDNFNTIIKFITNNKPLMFTNNSIMYSLFKYKYINTVILPLIETDTINIDDIIYDFSVLDLLILFGTSNDLLTILNNCIKKNLIISSTHKLLQFACKEYYDIISKDYKILYYLAQQNIISHEQNFIYPSENEWSCFHYCFYNQDLDKSIFKKFTFSLESNYDWFAYMISILPEQNYNSLKRSILARNDMIDVKINSKTPFLHGKTLTDLRKNHMNNIVPKYNQTCDNKYISVFKHNIVSEIETTNNILNVKNLIVLESNTHFSTIKCEEPISLEVDNKVIKLDITNTTVFNTSNIIDTNGYYSLTYKSIINLLTKEQINIENKTLQTTDSLFILNDKYIGILTGNNSNVLIYNVCTKTLVFDIYYNVVFNKKYSVLNDIIYLHLFNNEYVKLDFDNNKYELLKEDSIVFDNYVYFYNSYKYSFGCNCNVDGKNYTKNCPINFNFANWNTNDILIKPNSSNENNFRPFYIQAKENDITISEHFWKSSSSTNNTIYWKSENEVYILFSLSNNTQILNIVIN